MRFILVKKGEVVGEAVKLSEELVYYHLWKNITRTHECTFEELKKKFTIKTNDVLA